MKITYSLILPLSYFTVCTTFTVFFIITYLFPHTAFGKDRAKDRRAWLSKDYDSKIFICPSKTTVTYEEFVRKELIHFSFADNQRSLPSAIDGLKPSQRKVLYGCFMKKLDREVKVVQLAGYIAENTCYHHGEQSLYATIINMAQDYVGSNNVPLLTAAGQFGTRAQVCSLTAFSYRSLQVIYKIIAVVHSSKCLRTSFYVRLPAVIVSNWLDINLLDLVLHISPLTHTT